ncbi:MAG: hypothetical protein HUU54_01930 [Ignavibacteriaceae bacterium]|nr:hypothetical protein [Ignavibacteriaceae bacterium]
MSCKEDTSNPVTPTPEEPVIKVISPTSTTEIIDSVMVEVEATDNKGVTKVEFYVDNVILKTWTVPPYEYLWKLTNQEDSSKHSIYFKAYDADGNITTTEILFAIVRRMKTPNELNVIKINETEVWLKWKGNRNIAEKYEFEAKANEGIYEVIGETGAENDSVRILWQHLYDTKYSFRMRAKKGNYYSNYSNVVSNIYLLPKDFTLTKPINGSSITGRPIVFEWNQSMGAVNYALQIAKSSNFDTIYYQKSGLTATSDTVETLKGNTKYYWKVQGYNRVNGETTSDIWEVNIEAYACNGVVEYEGKIYGMVKIGEQCWIKENLNVGTRINGAANPSNNGTVEKYCYNDNEANCNTYGGLYTWNEAMGYSTTAGVRGICPEGWHIPTNAEFQTLASSVSNNSNALKAVGQGTGSGAGTNTSGFSALLAGYRYYGGYFVSLSDFAYFWSSTEYSSPYARFIGLDYNGANITFNYYYKEFGFSVRCVED